MKTLTLKQPWATLIAHGYKKYEFRTWKTNYRGPIYIHAGKGIEKDALNRVSKLNLDYPSSEIVAKVNIVDCIELTPELNEKLCSENRDVYGFNNHTGYVWILSNPEIINSKEKLNGKLSFWEYELK